MPADQRPVLLPTGESPQTWTIDGQGTVDLQSVFASFDGSGAAGEFRPAVTISAQDGTILSRTFPTETVAAGDTAEVTYAPFLRPFGGGATPALTVMRQTINGNPVSCANNATVALTWDSPGGPDSLVDCTNPSAPVLINDGIYWFRCVIATDTATQLNVGSFFAAATTVPVGGSGGSSGFSFPAVATMRVPSLNLTDFGEGSAGAGLVATARLLSGTAARSFSLAQADIMRLA